MDPNDFVYDQVDPNSRARIQHSRANTPVSEGETAVDENEEPIYIPNILPLPIRLEQQLYDHLYPPESSPEPSSSENEEEYHSRQIGYLRTTIQLVRQHRNDDYYEQVNQSSDSE